MLSDEKIGQSLATVFGLSGKTAVITGAGSGLGRETAKLMASVGAQVVVADINLEAARETEDLITETGGQARALMVDISEEAAVEQLFADARAAFGNVAILVNNAAYRSKAEFFDMPVDEWDKMHRVTTRGTFLCCREAIKQMREAGGGSIVNISSTSAAHTTLWGINYHYDSAKSGVDALTRGLAGEFAADNIRVNSVLPGGMASAGGKNISESFHLRGPMIGVNRIPLQRVAEPMEVAQVVLFLAGPASSYVTGQLLAADGGFQIS